ncbi:16S rRNA (guanine(527)-N(7))-methyltransferase RsmG [Ottowia thiooxydans]|uniref:16S rRNA (guanine(527)-N(7))-methyltransferase RsmG n=1 Tax=Ottowia thiooxydans TaxID=219182 RepID=UPI00339278EF
MSHPFQDQLVKGLTQLGLSLSSSQQQKLLAYLDLLSKWNKVYNLTAVRDPGEMLTHHLLDSLAVIFPLRTHTQGKPVRLMDVGSGGGLPGVVIAVCCPEIEVVCVDAVAKKAAFIQQAAGTLGLPNLRGVHSRVESIGQEFDVITSRAFASLVDFTQWSRASLREGGVWMAMKAKHPVDELAQLPSDVSVFHVEQLEVPGLGAERCIIWMKPHVEDAS